MQRPSYSVVVVAMLIVALESSLAGSAVGQGVGRPSANCADCRIAITRVAQLGRDDSEGFIPRMPEGAARDQRGRIVLTFGSAGVPKMYAPDGRFLGRLGRTGGGPGEFRRATKVAFDENDSLFVFDASRQISVFAPEGHFVRAFAAPELPTFTPLVLAGGQILAAGTVPTRSRAGFGLHLGDTRGNARLSFALLPNPTPTAPQPRYVIARSAADSRVWVIRNTDYVLEQWTLAGHKVATLSRRPAWFDLRSGQAEEKGPASLVTAIDADSTGRLWIAARVKSAEWAKYMPSADASEVSGNSMLWDGLFDSIIECFDAKSGAVLASTRIPELVIAALGHGYFAAFHEDADGATWVGVIRVSLVRSANK